MNINENIATVQGLSFEEIIESINLKGMNLQLKISHVDKTFLGTKTTFDVAFPILLNTTISENGNYKFVQYLVAGTNDREQSLKELKKFQRQFKKVTGVGLLKNRFDAILNEPIWTANI